VYKVRGGGGARPLVALDDVTLSVRRGELFGVLGMNGAGKSTLLRILSAELRPSSGVAQVAGFDVCRYAKWVRRHVAIVNADDRPLMQLFAAPLSTGQRQRVKLVRGLLANATVLLLDQPTLGLDCNAARTARASIRRWMDDEASRTVVMATNDLAEANELCDRVAILDQGRLLACDTPAAIAGRWRAQPDARPEGRTTGAEALEAAFLRIVKGRAWAGA
jgi:ABC-2 type transport system ATP-binding protein